VLGSKMAYVDTGRSSESIDTTKPTILFIHGNPTSAYLYRNIIPHLSSDYRCVAPDLIGMGASDKPKIEYRFVEHARYLSAFLDAVVPQGNVVLVIQDWGSALGFDWAYQHQERTIGLAFFEFMRPFQSFEDFAPPGPVQDPFRSFRNESVGRQMIIDKNVFIEVMMGRATVRPLTAAEMEYYRTPFLDPPTREPLFRFPNEIPIEGQPAEVAERVTRYHEWLLDNELPKLFFWARPGRLVSEEKAKWYLGRLKNTTGVFVGQGVHFLQEDHPHRIGDEIAKWLASPNFA
jgi:haloalkane dehalogenase